MEAKAVPIEVLPPAQPPADHRLPDGAPIHALSALLLVAVDSLWAVFDWAPPIWIVAIPFCFIAVFAPTYLIQRNLKHDSKARALTFAMILGVLAAIPLPIAGMAASTPRIIAKVRARALESCLRLRWMR